jgi:hypothetical protein
MGCSYDWARGLFWSGVVGAGLAAESGWSSCRSYNHRETKRRFRRPNDHPKDHEKVSPVDILTFKSVPYLLDFRR